MDSIRDIFLVASGGALGSALRFLLARWVDASATTPYSLGTISVNVLGCFLAGALLARFGFAVSDIPSSSRLFLLTGALGGFTTFSAFSLDVLQVYRSAGVFMATMGIAFNVAGSLAATAVGFWLSRPTS